MKRLLDKENVVTVHSAAATPEVSQNNVGIVDIGFELVILTGLIFAMTGIIFLVGKQKRPQIVLIFT